MAVSSISRSPTLRHNARNHRKIRAKSAPNPCPFYVVCYVLYSTFSGIPRPMNTLPPADNTALSPLELQTLADLLGEAAAEFAGHSANDYSLPANPDTHALLTRVIAHGRQEYADSSLSEVVETSGRYHVHDHWLMHYLAQRCAGPESLDKAELLALADVLQTLARDDFEIYDSANIQGMYQLALTEDEAASNSLIQGAIAAAQEAAADNAWIDPQSIVNREEEGYVGVETVWLMKFLAKRCEALAPSRTGTGKPKSTAAAAPKAPAADRPGVSEKWRKQLKRSLTFRKSWQPGFETRERSALEYYVHNGIHKPIPGLALEDKPPVPPWKPWNTRMPVTERYAAALAARWELDMIVDGMHNASEAATALNAMYLSQLKMVHLHFLRDKPSTEPRGRVDVRCISFAAFGVATGQMTQSLRLARVQLRAVRMGFHNPSSYGCFTSFTLRLFADYLGEPSVHVEGDPEYLDKSEVRGDPIVDGLLAVWRDPDPSVLLPHCLAVCDLHTHHAHEVGDSWWREYKMYWSRTPVVVLLVLKLRELLGLQNPHIDHPMMDDMRPLLASSLPPAEPDDLIKAVRAQMEKDGFDERAVLADLGIAWDGSN